MRLGASYSAVLGPYIRLLLDLVSNGGGVGGSCILYEYVTRIDVKKSLLPQIGSPQPIQLSNDKCMAKECLLGELAKDGLHAQAE